MVWNITGLFLKNMCSCKTDFWLFFFWRHCSIHKFYVLWNQNPHENLQGTISAHMDMQSHTRTLCVCVGGSGGLGVCVCGWICTYAWNSWSCGMRHDTKLKSFTNTQVTNLKFDNHYTLYMYVAWLSSLWTVWVRCSWKGQVAPDWRSGMH